MASNDQKLDLKIEALRAAVDTYDGDHLMCPRVGECQEETYAKGTATVLATAQRYYGWLLGASRIRLLVGPVVAKAADAVEPKTASQEGETVQINTGQKFSVELDAKDAAGYDTDVDVTWSIDDTSIATVEVDTDNDQKGWVVSGAPGSCVLTVSVNGTDPALTATLAVDVVPAGVATVELVTGDPVAESDTPAPTPEPGV